MSAFSDAVLGEVARAARPGAGRGAAQHIQYYDDRQQAGAPKYPREYVQTPQYVVANHAQPQYIAIQQVAGGHPGSAGQPQIILVQQQASGMGHHAGHRQSGGYHPRTEIPVRGGGGSNGMHKRKFESRDNGRSNFERSGPRQAGGYRAGSCRDCGKKAKFGDASEQLSDADEMKKMWCGACAKKHPTATRMRTKGEQVERAKRSTIFAWAKAADPPRCAFFNLVAGCPSFARGTQCERMHECKNCGLKDPEYKTKNCPVCPDDWWKSIVLSSDEQPAPPPAPQGS